MKKRIVSLLLCVFLGTGTLAGCAETPKDSLVKMKGKSSEKNYEEADDTEENTEEEKKQENKEDHKNQDGNVSGIRKTVNAPETVKSEVTDETGKIKILTDAKVEIPNADKASAIQVSQHEFDQEMMDKITSAFFPDAKIYSASSYYQRTKEDVRKDITEMKGYLSEGNLDPYDMGTDENGNLLFEINSYIEELEIEYESAPEKRVLEEVKPAFGAGEEEEMNDYFDSYVEDADGKEYKYEFKRYNSMPMEVAIERIYKEVKGENTSVNWYEYMGDAPDSPSKEEMEKKIKLSPEDALAIAQEKVELLEIPNMEMTEWEYAVAWAEDFAQSGDEYKRTAQDFGYVFHYTRKLGNIPITYTMEWGGALEEMDSDMETWGYEVLNIYVGSDGIGKVEFNNLYDIGETKTQQVNLKSFDEIMDIYEKMMLIQNANMGEDLKSEVFHIDRITFGYSRIYEPSTDSTSGILVPVWDFFGSSTSEYTTGETYTNDLKYQSYLTINAIDGSVIKRGLGY